MIYRSKFWIFQIKLYNIVIMNVSKLITVLVLLLCFGATTSVMAQGRKKEHRNQRGGGFRLKKSGGHADAFAKGGKKGGFLSKVFKKNKNGSAWVYKKTKPGMKQNKEQPKLFTRNRTKSKKYRDGVIARQNRQRSSTRVRGSSSFSKAKR